MNPFHFIQLADPQFGMYASYSGLTDREIAERLEAGNKVQKAPKTEGFKQETKLFEQAVSEANRLQPDFVVTCGDIVMDWDNKDQADEAHRIAMKLEPTIPMYWVPGNHDLGMDGIRPTPKTIARYRHVFGPDYYSFEHKGVSFIVINSTVIHTPDEVPEEWEAQLRFIKKELSVAHRRGSAHIVVFSHHPFFLNNPNEDVEKERSLVIPLKRRKVVLNLLKTYGVSAVFAGHWHRNNYARYGNMLMIASGSVGYPLGNDPSGYRVVRVYDNMIDHDYYGFGNGPASVQF